MTQRTLIEFGDCEVAGVDAVAEGLCIRFSAAQVLRFDEAAPERPEAGFARGVELVLRGVGAAELPPDCFGRLAQGRVEWEGQWQSRMALPFSTDSAVQVDFSFANRTQLILRAEGLECRYTGEANFAESLFC